MNVIDLNAEARMCSGRIVDLGFLSFLRLRDDDRDVMLETREDGYLAITMIPRDDPSGTVKFRVRIDAGEFDSLGRMFSCRSTRCEMGLDRESPAVTVVDTGVAAWAGAAR